MRLPVYNLLFLLLLFSCINTEENSKAVNNLEHEISLLKKSIVINGDVSAYNELSARYIKREKYFDILPFSFIMAGEYEYLSAYYDVFFYVYAANSNSCFDYDLSCLDSQTKTLALKYLKLGVEKGDEACSNVVLNFYNKGKHYPIKELYTNTELLDIAKSNIKRDK